MAIKRIVIGSTNPGKIEEWKKLLGKAIDIVSVAEIGKYPDPPETGKTFAENAALKARHYSKLVNEVVLADDGGFEIDALNGAPGIKSRRILPGDKDGTDRELVDYIISKMKSTPKEKRTARLVAYVAVSDRNGNIIFEDKGEKSGLITEKLMTPIIPGYPYRSILYLPDVGKTYADLTDGEHQKFNHRKKIAERLIRFVGEHQD